MIASRLRLRPFGPPGAIALRVPHRRPCFPTGKHIPRTFEMTWRRAWEFRLSGRRGARVGFAHHSFPLGLGHLEFAYFKTADEPHPVLRLFVLQAFPGPHYEIRWPGGCVQVLRNAAANQGVRPT